MADLPGSMKAPPIYKEGNSYTEYVRDLEIWLLLKVATAEEQGVLVFRTLTGKAKAACHDLTVAQIGSDQGLQLIRERLDRLYLGEENQRIYDALDTFEKFKRTPSMTMSDFIFQFEQLHSVVNAHNVIYPDNVLAYRLIRSSNLSTYHEQLILTTIATGQFNYTAVVDQLKKAFGAISVNKSQDLPIKVNRLFIHLILPNMRLIMTVLILLTILNMKIRIVKMNNIQVRMKKNMIYIIRLHLIVIETLILEVLTDLCPVQEILINTPFRRDLTLHIQTKDRITTNSVKVDLPPTMNI